LWLGIPILNKDIVLVCDNLYKTYEEGSRSLQVLSGINFDISKSERVAIVDVSGPGKSTLLNMLGGLDLPSEGTVTACGKNLATLNESERDQLCNQYLRYCLSVSSFVAGIYCN